MYSTKSDSKGSWKLKVQTPSAGGPYAITISDGKILKLNDVLIGEVWVFSGQSNMEMPLKGFLNQPIIGSNHTIATSKNKSIRFYTVIQDKSLVQKDDFDGELMRTVSPELRKRILKDYYWPHHAKLSHAVNKQLQLFGKALILDCHAYPSKPFKRDLDKSLNRPDFNIGTDSFHTPKHLIEVSKAFFENAGYTVGID
jgi:hypothetical protein